MNLHKILSLLLAFLLVIFVVVANFSATETRLQCNGSISGEPLKAFIKLQKYEWWVGLCELTPFFKQSLPSKPMSGIIHNF